MMKRIIPAVILNMIWCTSGRENGYILIATFLKKVALKLPAAEKSTKMMNPFAEGLKLVPKRQDSDISPSNSSFIIFLT